MREGLAAEPVLVRYLHRWRERLAKAQRGMPAKWKVPKLGEEELRDELEVILLTAVRKAHARGVRPLSGFEFPGEEATWRFLARENDALRRRRAIYLVPRRLRPKQRDVESVPMRGPDGVTARMIEEVTERVRSPEEPLAKAQKRCARGRTPR